MGEYEKRIEQGGVTLLLTDPGYCEAYKRGSGWKLYRVAQKNYEKCLDDLVETLTPKQIALLEDMIEFRDDMARYECMLWYYDGCDDTKEKEGREK